MGLYLPPSLTQPLLAFSRPPDTSLAVGRPFFHIEGSVADGRFAGGTGEAMHMPGHLQSMHDLLEEARARSGPARPQNTGGLARALPLL